MDTSSCKPRSDTKRGKFLLREEHCLLVGVSPFKYTVNGVKKQKQKQKKKKKQSLYYLFSFYIDLAAPILCTWRPQSENDKLDAMKKTCCSSGTAKHGWSLQYQACFWIEETGRIWPHMVHVAIILLRCLSQLLFALPLLYELEWFI